MEERAATEIASEERIDELAFEFGWMTGWLHATRDNVVRVLRPAPTMREQMQALCKTIRAAANYHNSRHYNYLRKRRRGQAWAKTTPYRFRLEGK